MEEKKNIDEKLRQAVADIKEAILQGQYEACKGVNRIQLAVYYGIGKYISQHTRKDVWGTGALEAISSQLRRELPGLRGYSATSLKKMRLFYENWIMLDANSSVATDELKSTITIAETASSNSSVITDDLLAIDIYHTLMVPITREFPVEDFFNVPFTHHVEIYKQQDLLARYYYIHRTAEEHLSVDALKKLLKNDAYGHREQMGVATYKTADEMPENIRKALPDMEDFKKLLGEKKEG